MRKGGALVSAIKDDDIRAAGVMLVVFFTFSFSFSLPLSSMEWRSVVGVD